VRFLVDANLSPRLVDQLQALGHDAAHLSGLGLLSAPDERILELARVEGRVVISADSDFGTILAATHATTPSVLYLRGTSGRRVDALAARIAAALPTVESPLREGSLVVLEPSVVRIRSLPIL
jgi:predicted nuclease of predicted toxin-antitoxin system